MGRQAAYRDEARRIATNIAKLSELLTKTSGTFAAIVYFEPKTAIPISIRG